MKTGVNTSTIIYVGNRAKPPRGKNCIKCLNFFKGYCKQFNIRITDNTNAKVCNKYNELQTNERQGKANCKLCKFISFGYYCSKKKYTPKFINKNRNCKYYMRGVSND